MGGTIIIVGHAPSAPEDFTVVPPALADVADIVQSVAGEVLLLTRDAESRRIARATRLMLGSERIAVHHTEVPLTAWLLALHCIAPLTESWPIAQLGAALDASASATRTRVVLSNLTALDKPTPTFAQHLASMMPGSAFEVDLTAEEIRPVRETMPLEGSMAVIARSERAPHKVYREWDPEGLMLTEAEPGWHARRWCEVSELQISSAQLGEQLSRLPAARCPVCARTGSSENCLFCEVALSLGEAHQTNGLLVETGGVVE